jgi:hypothetical protein
MGAGMNLPQPQKREEEWGGRSHSSSLFWQMFVLDPHFGKQSAEVI